MKARKFGYDVAYASPSVHTSCKRMPDVRLFWRESVWLPASFEEETTKVVRDLSEISRAEGGGGGFKQWEGHANICP